MLGAVFGSMACGCTLSTFIVINRWTDQLNTKLDIAQKNLATQTFQTAKLYDRNGVLLRELFPEGRRTNIGLASVPKAVIDATIATEDRTFYENPGVDVSGIGRAGIGVLLTDEGVGGGSTITQQLVRNIVFDYQYRNERSVRRKLEEIGLALVMTQQMSKEQILELYLNQIYYGNLAYGIEAASQTYFGKPAAQLTLSEAALLAGLPQSPAELDPLSNDPRTQAKVAERRRAVLESMVAVGKLNRAEADAALRAPLQLVESKVKITHPHFTFYAESELKNLLGGLNLPPETLITRGLVVYTTLDSRYQTMTENAARLQIAAITAKNNAKNAAVVILKPSTGEILTMMGSLDYNDAAIKGKVNVTLSQQQPGSAIKPLTYAAAIERGDSPATLYWDTPQEIGLAGAAPYIPKNYDGRFHGVVRMRDALANSYNIPAVQALRRIGVPALLDLSERTGILSFGRDGSRYGLSLTLGGGELTPLELTQSYGVLANGGVFVPATSILCVLDNTGVILYQYERGCPKGNLTDKTINTGASGKPVLDPRISFVISDMLADNTARSPAMGSRSPLYTPNIPTSVKTGTTNDYRDNWTMGYTRNVVVGVWVGNTDNEPMINSSGLTGAAPIWNAVISGIYTDPALKETLKRGGSFLTDGQPQPPGLTRQALCNAAALRDPATGCPQGRVEWLLTSPALQPSEGGQLLPGALVAPTAQPGNGPRLVDIDPWIVQTTVLPLGGAGSGIPVLSVGRHTSPPPAYCLVPNEIAGQVPQAVQQVFIKPPKFADEEVFARQYAASNGIPILPPIPCTAELVSMAGNVNPGAQGVVANITAPSPGQAVSGTVSVIGTAIFSPGQALYYKVEIQGPQFPGWTTIDQTRNVSVSNGVLATFGATGLVPGTYQLRLVIVGMDANNLVTTPGIPVQVSGG
jgi:membrane peptidoglycan carboxypeptidase